MSVASKIRSLEKRREEPKGTTFKYFRRLLGYAWPHRRYLVPAIGCIFVMALAYSASIGSILPVLTVMIQEEGLHGSVERYAVRDRLKCDIVTYSPRDRQVVGIPPRTARVHDIDERSPLFEAGLREGDFILAVDGEEVGAYEVVRRLAEPATEIALTWRAPTTDEPESVSIELPPLDTKQAALHTIMSWIPRGQAPEDRWRTLIFVLVCLFGVVVLGNLARVFAEYLTIIVNTRMIMDLRRQMYAHVLKLPLGRFSQNTSDTMSMFMQDMNDILRGLNNFFQKVVAEPFKAVGVVMIALWLDWRLTLVLMLGAPLAVALFRRLGKKIRRANRKLLIGYGQMLGRLESTLAGMRVVKAYNRENYERHKLFKIDRRVLKQQLKMGFIEALTSPVVETLGFVVASGAILYFASQVLFHGIGPEQFITMLVCLGAIFDPIRKLSSVYPKLQRANAAAGRVFGLIDSPTEYERDTGRVELPTFRQQIEFDRVTFSYPGSERPAVHNVSMTVRKGEIIAIVGPNGSGKTTLLSLLPRFFEQQSGRILIDGRDTREVKLTSLRRQFSLITQESVIFPDSVRANIAYGRPDATEEEIVSAAKKAYADEFVRQMPEGYDTVIGEHGATLSGGQRQRLAIARAILRNAPIVIFDEATSQVDPESEMKIHQALEAILEDRTAFIIAHRYSTVSGADRIAVMDEGSLVAVGPHQQLLTSCALYKRLYETQFRSAG